MKIIAKCSALVSLSTLVYVNICNPIPLMGILQQNHIDRIHVFKVLKKKK